MSQPLQEGVQSPFARALQHLMMGTEARTAESWWRFLYAKTDDEHPTAEDLQFLDDWFNDRSVPSNGHMHSIIAAMEHEKGSSFGQAHDFQGALNALYDVFVENIWHATPHADAIVARAPHPELAVAAFLFDTAVHGFLSMFTFAHPRQYGRLLDDITILFNKDNRYQHPAIRSKRLSEEDDIK